ncbi:MAG TPA: SUMF1/EgtB/PvdO family nonheme iron enzyme [Pyrinomonadaceae bacterium]|nr:SUMF1/EgtB/PvdO family nonheme iron enzyme [Pyrinomonadaceae bacterium]
MSKDAAFEGTNSKNETSPPNTGATDAQRDDRAVYIAAPWQAVLPAAPRKRNIPWLPVTVAVGVTVIAVTAFAIVFGPKRAGPLPAVVIPTPPSGMVYVPGGEFRMGNDLGDEHERPAHMVTVRPFFLDQHEVACRDYEKFVKATNHRLPPGWVKGNCPNSSHQNPVTGVDWYDANAYAQWSGKRLPTEEEWEFAARGTDGRLYPWGNQWRNNVANAGDATVRHFANVGSYPDGKSPFGVMDMIGNAWEWTATEFRAYPGGQAPDQNQAELRVIRGGYWGSTPGKATATFRKGWDARGALVGYANTGFRCAKDL